ncbi:hypothetical protein EJB05_16941, partial [Eragrostis curvula]
MDVAGAPFLLSSPMDLAGAPSPSLPPFSHGSSPRSHFLSPLQLLIPVAMLSPTPVRTPRPASSMGRARRARSSTRQRRSGARPPRRRRRFKDLDRDFLAQLPDPAMLQQDPQRLLPGLPRHRHGDQQLEHGPPQRRWLGVLVLALSLDGMTVFSVVKKFHRKFALLYSFVLDKLEEHVLEMMPGMRS